jgi:hypothetical protein
MSTRPRLVNGATIAVALLCLFAGYVVGVNVSTSNQKKLEKTQQSFAERQAAEEAKEGLALAAPATERIYQTSRGELLMLGVNVKPKRDGIRTVACFVWLGNTGQPAMDCPQNPIDIDGLVSEELEMRSIIKDGAAGGGRDY